MSIRKRLKKAIYKGLEKGLDVSNLEQELRDIPLSTKQQIQKIHQEMAEIYHYLEENDYSPIVIDKKQELLNSLHIKLKPLQESLSIPNWELPYTIKRIIKQRGSYDLLLSVEDKYKNFKPDMILIENNTLVRYIIVSINGVNTRINVESKSHFIQRNWFWFQYSKTPKNYSNCLRLVY